MDVTDAKAAYERDGVCIVRGAFDPHWLATLERGVDAALAAPGPHAERYGPQGRERFFGDLDMWTRLPEFRDFVLQSPAAELVGRIMGSSAATFLYDQLLVKEPGSQERTPWHQDQPYWAVKGFQVCSIWLPLDRAPKDVSLEFIAGSHRWGKTFNPTHFSDRTPYEGTGLPNLPDIEAARGDYNIVSWDVEPGDCIVFQGMEMHGAPGNLTAGRRRVLATRWLGDDARFFKRPGEIAIPTTMPDLEDGAPFSGPMFPTVWSQTPA